MKFIDISTFFLAHEVDHFGYIFANLSSLASGREIKIIRCQFAPIDGLINTGHCKQTSQIKIKKKEEKKEREKVNIKAFTLIVIVGGGGDGDGGILCLKIISHTHRLHCSLWFLNNYLWYLAPYRCQCSISNHVPRYKLANLFQTIP